MKTIFKFKNAAESSADAQEVGETLMRIKKQHKGDLQVIDVLEEARDEESILHRFFEWDDDKAAEKFRMKQARDLIGTVIIVSSSEIELKEPVRAFLNISRENPEDDAPRKYISMVDMMKDPNYRRKMAVLALRDLNSYVMKYKQLSEFFPFETLELLKGSLTAEAELLKDNFEDAAVLPQGSAGTAFKFQKRAAHR